MSPESPPAASPGGGAAGSPSDRTERRILVYASALGREADFALLVDALGLDEETLVEAVERLVARGVLREVSGGDRFTFIDDERRVQIYRSLTQSRLRIVHRKLAEAMELRHPSPSSEIVAELGRHYFLGRVPEKSYAFNLEAADRAEEAGRTELAVLHLERVRLDRPNVRRLSPETDGRLAERLGRLYYALGDLRAAARLFAEGFDATPPEDLARQAELWIARAQVARDLRDTQTAVAGVRKAEALYETLDSAPGLALVHRTLARVAFDRGRYREALEEGMIALDLLSEANDPRTIGLLSVELGNAFQRLGPEVWEEAVEWYDRAIGRLKEAGESGAVAEAYRERGRTLAPHRPDEALEDLARSRLAAEAAHDPISEAWALLEAVPIRLALGQSDEAERDNQLAEQLIADREAPGARARAGLNAGVLKERRGQWEEAERAYRAALDGARREGEEGAEAEAHFLLARLLGKTGASPKAREEYEAASRLRLPVVRPGLAREFEVLGRELETPGPAAAEPEAPAARGGTD